MFNGLSKPEIIGWIICLIIAGGLTVFGSAYLAVSLMTADVSSIIR